MVDNITSAGAVDREFCDIESPQSPSQSSSRPSKSFPRASPSSARASSGPSLGQGGNLTIQGGGSELSSTAYSDQIWLFGTHPRIPRTPSESVRSDGNEGMLAFWTPLPTRAGGQDDGSLNKLPQIKMACSPFHRPPKGIYRKIYKHIQFTFVVLDFGIIWRLGGPNHVKNTPASSLNHFHTRQTPS